MSIKDRFIIKSIKKEETHDWLKNKHYAGRIPIITKSFGLFEDDRLVGVCTFGPPARMLNDGYGAFDGEIKVDTYELNRLVTNDSLPKNTTSYFVSSCLKKMPEPSLIVSYADANSGHHGYIYQATNFMYCGVTSAEKKYINKNTGEEYHPRTVVQMFGSREEDSLPEEIELSKEPTGKFKYFYFVGNKREVRNMKNHFKYEEKPYPKGDNDEYDASYQPQVQSELF